MRVIAGKWGGRAINAPKGRDTRPTTDRVKESLMSSIESAIGFDGACVLDAFAGSGSLGIEALSRGAKRVYFFDHANAAYSCVSSNIKALGAHKEEYRLYKTDVYKINENLLLENDAFHIVFLDPPYATPQSEILTLITNLKKSGMLHKKCLISYEHSADDLLNEEAFSLAGFTMGKSKKFGDIVFDFLFQEQ